MMTPPIILTRSIVKYAIDGLPSRRSLHIDCFTVHKNYLGRYTITHIDNDQPTTDMIGEAYEVTRWLIDTLALPE